MTDKRICEICGSKIAEHHFSKTTAGKSRDFHVCSGCKNVLDRELEKKSREAFMRSLPEEQRECVCTTTLTEIYKYGYVGCAECYTTFKNYLNDIIFGYHNSIEHIGRNGKARPPIDIEYLYTELKSAVEEERFEDADKIKRQIDWIKKDWESK